MTCLSTTVWLPASLHRLRRFPRPGARLPLPRQASPLGLAGYRRRTAYPSPLSATSSRIGAGSCGSPRSAGSTSTTATSSRCMCTIPAIPRRCGLMISRRSMRTATAPCGSEAGVGWIGWIEGLERSPTSTRGVRSIASTRTARGRSGLGSGTGCMVMIAPPARSSIPSNLTPTRQMIGGCGLPALSWQSMRTSRGTCGSVRSPGCIGWIKRPEPLPTTGTIPTTQRA